MSDLGSVIDRAKIAETSGGEQRSLRCSLSWSANKDELRRALAAAPYAGLLDRQALAEQTVTITLGGGHRRIDHSLFGEPTSVVDNGDQLVLVQHGARGYARLAKPAAPPVPVPPRLVSAGAPALTKQAAKLPGGGLGHELVITFRDGSQHFRQRLTLDPALQIGSLARDFLSVLVGDAGRHAAGGYPFEAVANIIAHEGLPIAGRLERTDASGKIEAEVSHFRVGDATLANLAVDAFAVPPGYRDLRAGGAAAGARIIARSRTKQVGAERRAAGTGAVRPAPAAAPPAPPPAPPITSQAVFGVLLEQRLLDHLHANVDLALEHLGGAHFQGKPGELVIDWLAKLRAAVLGDTALGPTHNAGLGGFLFSFLHDMALSPRGEDPVKGPNPELPDIEVPGWGIFQGRGALDRIARDRAEEIVRRFDPLKSIADAPELFSRLPAETLKALIGGKRWNQLDATERLHITFATLMTYYAALRAPLGRGPSKKISFNVWDIVEGELVDLTPSFTLPSKPTAGDVPLISALRCRADGGLDATLSLGAVEVRGTLNRRPGAAYYVLLAGSAAVSVFIPALAWLLPVTAALGAFLADSADLEVTIKKLRADVTLDFRSDAIPGRLLPIVKVHLSGDVDVELDSTIPTGLHELVDEILEAIAESGHILLDQLEAPLEEALQDVIIRALGGGIFASLAPLGVKVDSASARGKDDKHVYYEARLGLPSGAEVSAKPVRAYTPDAIRLDAEEVVEQDDKISHYFTLATSQNMLNVLLAGLRRSGMLGGAVPSGKLADFQPAAQKLYLAGKSVAGIKRIHLAVTKAPFALGTTPSAGSPSHGQTELGAVLTVECPKRRFEWTLALRTPVQVVIGSARASTTPTIHIFTMIDQPLDVLFDIAQATVTVQKLTVTEQENKTLPGTVETDPSGKPIHTGGEVEVVDLPPVQIDLKDPKLDLKAHAAFVLGVVGLLLERRDARHAPRRDGAPEGKADPLALQRYTLDGNDPDLDGGQLYVQANLRFDEGGLLLHGSLAGSTASFDETHHLSPNSLLRRLGVLAARGIYLPLD